MSFHSVFETYSGDERVFAGRKTVHYTRNFATKIDKIANAFCRVDREIAPNLFQLRQPSQVEQDLLLDQARSEEFYDGYPRKCDGETRFEYFAAYTESGNPIGEGNCHFQTESSGNEGCHFRIWIAPGITAHLRFRREYLLDFHNIYFELQRFLIDSTVKDKTKNISFEGQLK